MPTLQKTATTYQVGDVTISRLDELQLTQMTPAALLPDWRPELIDSQRDAHDGLPFPASWDADRTHLLLSIHTWVLRTPRHTILIDTASGNGKPRPFFPALDNLNQPYLEGLQNLGVTPQDVDYVLLTHLHIDHVGWNTQRVNGRWTPTFPNARYLMSKREYENFETLRDTPQFAIFEDSVQPVFESGQADFVTPDGPEILEGIQFHSTPGHSPDHMSISLRSQGEEAIFAGDVMHHPLQVLSPELNSVFCPVAEQSRTSRRWVLDYAAERQALYFSTHFPETSAGRITRQGGRYTWQYV